MYFHALTRALGGISHLRQMQTAHVVLSLLGPTLVLVNAWIANSCKKPTLRF